MRFSNSAVELERKSTDNMPPFRVHVFPAIWSSLWKDFIKGKGGPPFKSYSGGQDSRMRKSEKGFHMVFGDKN